VAHLSFRGIVKRFGDVTAVDDVTLDIAAGEFVSLVSASGCGKTTLLRIIAGFTRADSGTLPINGRHVDTLPPNKRGVGFVFQSYALFPTQTVAQNIGSSLSVRRRPKDEISRRVAELCELTQLLGLEDRYPHEISGGQQQRVALARAPGARPSHPAARRAPVGAGRQDPRPFARRNTRRGRSPRHHHRLRYS
jgi:putative spermidine/putrescine transport system ATP-binding protein